jgi:uncharacterized pyridoxal phosphate-containing UPF0001 family protein
VLLEVNTSGEASKHGVSPEAASALTEHLLEKCPFLSVEGFMTVGPLEGGECETAAAFVRLRTLRMIWPVVSDALFRNFPWA